MIKQFTSKVKVYSVLLCALALSACGFQLRGNYLIPEPLQTIYLTSEDKHSELTRVVKQHLEYNKVNMVQRSSEQVASMKLLKDKLDRRTLSVFPNGQVAEYELIYAVAYQIALPGEDPQLMRFEINRDYQDDPNFTLAKSRELKLILSEMRQEAAEIILRKMAAHSSVNN